MSELSIFSLLVVGRDPPPPLIPTSGADYRPIDRTVPIGQQREAFGAKTTGPKEATPQRLEKVVS